MTTPNNPHTNLPAEIRFPRTREQAEIVARQVRDQAARMGCRCQNLKIEFVEPRVRSSREDKPYVYVEHESLCLLAYGSGSN